MSRNEAARSALLLGRYEQALQAIVEQADLGVDALWVPDCYAAFQRIHALAAEALQGKRPFRLGEPPAQGKPSKK